MRNAYKILFRKPEGKSPWSRWGNNIYMDFKEIGCDDVD